MGLIKNRIEAEHRKHKRLDWEKITEIKIVSELKFIIDEELKWITNEIVRLDETYKNRPSLTRDKTKIKYRKAVKHLNNVRKKIQEITQN